MASLAGLLQSASCLDSSTNRDLVEIFAVGCHTSLVHATLLRLLRSGLAAVIFWIGVILTVFTAYLAHERSILSTQIQIREAAAEIRARILLRFEFYETALHQLRGLFQLGVQRNRESFHILTESIQPLIRGGDIVGVGYAELTSTSRQKQASAKAVTRFFKSMKSTLPAERLLGYVLNDHPTLLNAATEARDSGQTVLSRGLTLPFDADGDPVIVMIMPVFKSGERNDTVLDRQKSVQGFVFAALSAQTFFPAPFSMTWLDRHHVEFSVFDTPLNSSSNEASTVTPLFQMNKDGQSGLRAELRQVVELSVAGRSLWLLVETRSGVSSAALVSASLIIMLVGLSLSYAIYLILRESAAHSSDLLKSEKQLRLITDALPALISYIDIDERFRFNSRTYESWYRVRRELLLGQKVSTVMNPITYAQSKPYIERALRGETVSFETELLLPTEQKILVHAQYIPDFAANGRIKGFVALVSDITERRREEARGRFLVELSAVLGASLDVDAILERLAHLLTPSLADWCVLDICEDQGLRRVTASCSDPEKKEMIDQLRPGALSTLAIHNTKLNSHLVTINGEPLLVQSPSPESLVPSDREAEITAVKALGHTSAMIVPLRARNHILGALTLVSSRPEHKFSNDDLAFVLDIARRSALAIDNARLFRQAQQANRAKDEFLATLSHELRTPMNVILGWLELLSSESFDRDTFVQALDTLNRNARLQLQLITDLLDVSKIVNGKLTLALERADLALLAEAALEGFAPAARAKDIRLDLRVETSETCVLGDGSRLHQVLWNLLSNAIKFTPHGGVISIEIREFECGLELVMADNGRGIEGRFLSVIFDRFRQEESGSIRSQGGLGLGLSIVRYLMELHGGSVEAASEGRDKGATFTLRFPRRFAGALEQNHDYLFEEGLLG